MHGPGTGERWDNDQRQVGTELSVYQKETRPKSVVERTLNVPEGEGVLRHTLYGDPTRLVSSRRGGRRCLVY